MPPMGPPGRKNDFKKPKNAKQTFTRILKYPNLRQYESQIFN